MDRGLILERQVWDLYRFIHVSLSRLRLVATPVAENVMGQMGIVRTNWT